MNWCALIYILAAARTQVYSGEHCKMSEATHKILLQLPGLNGRENKWHVIRNTVTAHRVREQLENFAAEKGKAAPVSVAANSEDIEASFNRDLLLLLPILMRLQAHAHIA